MKERAGLSCLTGTLFEKFAGNVFGICATQNQSDQRVECGRRKYFYLLYWEDSLLNRNVASHPSIRLFAHGHLRETHGFAHHQQRDHYWRYMSSVLCTLLTDDAMVEQLPAGGKTGFAA